MKTKLTIAVLLCLLVLPVAFAAFPGDWWGEAYIDGELVPDGTSISAYVNDNLVATTHVGDKLGSGYYELVIEANDGDQIIFKIESIEAGTAVFSDGAHEQLDLNSAEPVCGDGICNGDETCSTCPEDCEACPPSDDGSRSSSSGGRGGGGSSCTPKWQLGEWTKCSPEGTQTRSYIDKNNCGITVGKPEDQTQTCNYVPPRTTKTQEKETEPETTSGEDEPVPVEEPATKEEQINDTGKPNLITGAVIGVDDALKSGWGIGIIIFIVAVFLLFLYTRKRKQSESQ